MKKKFVVIADKVAYRDKEASVHFLDVDRDSGGYPYWSSSWHSHSIFDSKQDALKALAETKADKRMASDATNIRAGELWLLPV